MQLKHCGTTLEYKSVMTGEENINFLTQLNSEYTITGVGDGLTNYTCPPCFYWSPEFISLSFAAFPESMRCSGGCWGCSHICFRIYLRSELFHLCWSCLLGSRIAALSLQVCLWPTGVSGYVTHILLIISPLNLATYRGCFTFISK